MQSNDVEGDLAMTRSINSNFVFMVTIMNPHWVQLQLKILKVLSRVRIFQGCISLYFLNVKTSMSLSEGPRQV